MGAGPPGSRSPAGRSGRSGARLRPLGGGHHLPSRRARGAAKDRSCRQIGAVQQVDDGRGRQRRGSRGAATSPRQGFGMEVLGHQQGTAGQQRGSTRPEPGPVSGMPSMFTSCPPLGRAEVDGLAGSGASLSRPHCDACQCLGKPGGARGHVQGEHVVPCTGSRPRCGMWAAKALSGPCPAPAPVHGGPALAHHRQDGAAQLRVVDEDRRAQAFQHVQHGQRGRCL